MIIKTKKESSKFIEKLDLNRMPEMICRVNDICCLKTFIENHPYPLYVLRNPDVPSSKYKYIKTYDEVQEHLIHFNENIMISASVNGYKDNKILLGSIEILENNNIRLSATKNKELDHRTMFNEKIDFDFEVDIQDKIIDSVPYFNELYACLTEKGIIGMTVEFTIYDIPVGIKKTNILISEIRNY